MEFKVTGKDRESQKKLIWQKNKMELTRQCGRKGKVELTRPVPSFRNRHEYIFWLN